MNDHESTVTAVLAKLSPPAVVSVATIFGYPVSNLVLWATLIYTTLMIVQKAVQIWRDFRGRKSEKTKNS